MAQAKSGSGSVNRQSINSTNGPLDLLPEERVDRLIDYCTTSAMFKGGAGFGLGILCRMLIGGRGWAHLLGASFGLGVAYKDCERNLKFLTQCKSSE